MRVGVLPQQARGAGRIDRAAQHGAHRRRLLAAEGAQHEALGGGDRREARRHRARRRLLRREARARVGARRLGEVGDVEAAAERRARLVEGEVAVAADAEELQLHAAERTEARFVRGDRRRRAVVRHREERAARQPLAQRRAAFAQLVHHAAEALRAEAQVLVEVRRDQPAGVEATGREFRSERVEERGERAAGGEAEQWSARARGECAHFGEQQRHGLGRVVQDADGRGVHRARRLCRARAPPASARRARAAFSGPRPRPCARPSPARCRASSRWRARRARRAARATRGAG